VRKKGTSEDIILLESGSNQIRLGKVIIGILPKRLLRLKKFGLCPAIRHGNSLVGGGFRTFDTADSYGINNLFLKKIIKANGRQKLTIISKVYFPFVHIWRKGNIEMFEGGLSETAIKRSIDFQLKYLDTDYIDILLAHRYDPQVPLEEIAETFAELMLKGKILGWGLSEWPLIPMRRILEYVRLNEIQSPVVNQVQSSLLWRVSETKVRDLCEEFGVHLIGHAPLAHGLLTGKYGNLPRNFQKGSSINRDKFVEYFFQNGATEEICNFAKEFNLEMPDLVALSIKYVLEYTGCSSVVTSIKDYGSFSQFMSNLDRIELDLVEIFAERLSPYAIKKITRIGLDNPD